MSQQMTATWPQILVDWYAENKRILPWRRTQDAYHVWVSEIMLQQTRIEAVMGYYHRFMEAFPTVEDLAGAPIEQVLKLWEGLGYYSRARNLHKAAQQVVERGDFPSSYEEIVKLPGIGDYTAGAIAAIAFGQPVTAIDGTGKTPRNRLRLPYHPPTGIGKFPKTIPFSFVQTKFFLSYFLFSLPPCRTAWS